MPNTPEHLDEWAEASLTFARRAQSIAGLLRHRLETTLAAHDLSEKRLWAAHREMADLGRRGGAPTPADYWEKTAYPRAQQFLAEMIDAITAEEEELMRAFQQFGFAVAEKTRQGAPSIDGNPLHRHSPAGGADIDLDTARAVAQTAVDEFVAAAVVGNRINQVGAWWQGRLRRTAIIASAGRLLITPVGRYDIEVTAAEMRLLGGPPWSLDDRLLSAYELAHSDLRDHVAKRRSDLQRRFRAMLCEAGGHGRRQADQPRSKQRAGSNGASTADAIELG